MGLKKIKVILVVAVLSLVSTNVSAQDLLARQAPVDRHMRTLDTLALKTVVEREEAQMPASKLYGEWNNKFAHQTTELPDSFRINLRGFHMPTDSRVVTSNFGARWGRQHKGLDIKVYIGDTIRAAFTGKVRVVRYEAAGYGKYVVIRHNNGLETIYGHMSAWLVEENQTVKAGQPIGLGGNTGRSTGSHLHFETRLCGVAINPALMFDFRNQDVTGDYYVFHKSTYVKEGHAANALRGKTANMHETVAEAHENAEVAEAVNANVGVRYHKVTAGETLTSISKRRGVSVSELRKMNHLPNNVKVRVGQLLRYS